MAEAATGLPPEVTNFQRLRAHLRAILIRASKEERVREPQHQVENLLRACERPGSHLAAELGRVGKGARVLLGGGFDNGVRFSEGQKAPHFTRWDGASIDFSLTVREEVRRLDLLGYSFRIQFAAPDKRTPIPGFLRVDMNLSIPGEAHDNELDGVRVHLHPGNNDLQIPLPWLSPEQVLKLFLYGLEVPAKQRHDQA